MRPSPRIASTPWAANAAPTTPPMRACEDDDGSPKYQVEQVPRDRADQPGEDDLQRDQVRLDDALGDRGRDLERRGTPRRS